MTDTTATIGDLCEALQKCRTLHNPKSRPKQVTLKILEKLSAQPGLRMSSNDLRGAIGFGKDEKPNLDAAWSRFKKDLQTAFTCERSLWRFGRVLVANPKEGNHYSLAEKPLSAVLDPSQSFWQHFLRTLSQDRQNRNSFVVYSEPLFFFSKSTRSYLRILDVNLDAFATDRRAKALEALREHIAGLRARGESISADYLQNLVDRGDLSPVLHYVSAGDMQAAQDLRRWFRESTETKVHPGHNPGYKKLAELAPQDLEDKHLIHLGNPRHNQHISRFQCETPGLRYTLTPEGVNLDGTPVPDEMKNGVRVAGVVFTHWYDSRTNVFQAILGANHGRAIECVVKWLVTRDNAELRRVVEALEKLHDGRMPQRFQIAFRVEFADMELRGNQAPQIVGDPVVYDAQMAASA